MRTDTQTDSHSAPATDREIIARAKRQSITDRRSRERAQARLSHPDLRLSIEHVSVPSIRAYGRRLRKSSNAHQEKLEAPIGAFGLVLPLLVDGEGMLIDGHALFEAAKALGITEVPVVRASHLDEAQVKALRIGLNRLPELNTWDEAALALEFKDLLELDLTLNLSFDLSITGFSHPEIDQLIERPKASSMGEDADDAVPEVDNTPAVSRLGDIWQLGDHRSICGDATDHGTYRALLGDERATMSISDVPYNLKIDGHVSKSGRHREFVMASGEMSRGEFTDFLTRFLQGSTAMVHPGAIQFVFMDWRHMGEVLAAGEACSLELKNLCVWNKGSGAMGSFYRSQHELVFVFKEPNGPHLNNIQLGKFGRTRTNVWDHPGASSLREELKLHATPKPVTLIAEAIRDCSKRGEIVLDAFAGSGTTLIAAAKTGRRAYVIELDPKFVDVAVRRWEAWSGQLARHAATGLTFAETQAIRSQEAAEASPSSNGPSPAPHPEAASPVRVRRRARAA
jgi:DNA modification methylase